MTDEDLRDDDLRDEALAARLEVEPLDDVTKRRLVSTAMTESAPTHQRVVLGERWLAAVAAVVLVVIGIVALLVAHTHHDDRQSASPVGTPARSASDARAPTAAETAPTTAAPDVSGGDVGALGAADSSAADLSPVAPVDVGDFGNLDRAANLDRLRRALAPPTPTASTDGRGSSLVLALSGRGCTGTLPPGMVTAVATGTLGGSDAIVVRTTLADGSRSIDAVVGNGCTVRPLS